MKGRKEGRGTWIGIVHEQGSLAGVTVMRVKYVMNECGWWVGSGRGLEAAVTREECHERG